MKNFILTAFMAYKKLFITVSLVATLLLLSSWGFHAHRIINRSAVYTLPFEIALFFKKHIEYISEHAIDPDKRRYAIPEEAARHFIDLDRYGEYPLDSIPKKWNDAINKYSEVVVKENGIVPWHIYRNYLQLTEAFKAKNTRRIIKLAADLGHYIADAHTPLHTTQNYNGQLTDQVGIHAFWESRLPELYSNHYSFFVGKAEYLDDPLAEAWKIVAHSYSLVDSVLLIEARLNKTFSPDKKYVYEARNNILDRTYSVDYSKAYHNALQGMVEEQMRSSIRVLGNFWYTAWVDAGQPIL